MRGRLPGSNFHAEIRPNGVSIASGFTTKKNHHYFCKHCGVRAFGLGTETPMGKMYGVNVMCIEDVSDEDLAKLPITYVDGRNDRWQSAPEFFVHL